MSELRTADARHAQRPADREAFSFYSRWEEIQARFVQEPRRSVREANALVAEVKGRLGETFTDERLKAEAQWAPYAEASTEDLREALERYRILFEHLLATSERLDKLEPLND
jgi:hypothetical protein